MVVCDSISKEQNLTIKKEKYIPGHVESLSDFQLKKIMEQRNRSICKIEIDGQVKGTGFLCLIPYLIDSNY